MEVKEGGKYLTRAGREVEIYGFDGDNAEGFFTDDRMMGWWDVKTGSYRWGKGDESKDIVSPARPADSGREGKER